MTPENSAPKAPDDFDPDQTLFFQRRKQSVNLLPIIVVCILLLGSGALIVWALNQPDKNAAREHGGAPAASREDADRPILTPEQARAVQNAPRPQATVPRAVAVDTPVPYDASKPVRPALPANADAFAPTPVPVASAIPVGTAQPVDAAGDLPPVVVPDANAPLNLDVQDPGNAQVRADVLRRIDLMPGITAANKDKLYASVDHARSMGRVLTIPFVKGEVGVRPADVERLKGQLNAPAIRATLDDPTAVFVILGYADPKGNDKVNADLSLSRAKAVMDALREKCGVLNVMHTVAMGGSTLFSANQAEKNRVVEVWAVLP